MSNMIPQAPRNNRRTWDNLEMYLRSLVDEGDESYSVMESYGKGEMLKLTLAPNEARFLALMAGSDVLAYTNSGSFR